MQDQRIQPRKWKVRGAALGLVVVLVPLAGCSGGGDSDVPTTDSAMLTKNMPLNNCVSVMSGARPSPGVTTPRCIPSTTVKKP